MSANLKITFATEGGKDYTLNITDCKEQLENYIVTQGISNIIESNALDTPYGKPTSAKKAVLYVPTTSTYDVK